MPCNSDYMDPTREEINISQVGTLIDELNGKGFDKHHWKGHHPIASKFKKGTLNELTKMSCGRLRGIDVTKYSLEMQIWWRDHKAADKQRVEREQAEMELAVAKKKALAKLTLAERKVLGLHNES